MIMSTPEHVYPARLIEKLMNTDVFGKENELNKVPKSTASISDPAHMSILEHVYPARLIDKLMKNDVYGK